ncbi:hypothetical protein OOK41_25490 [Micromonospora sp. NBC_01655]|uniref:hypothetical protein n=1 Tax=Micromonospora sp. NBC_01655 TaxID=2975983 RepID=UPI00225C2E44|nr:hypothetical protein [Micromonospora sp. NBC_01655]MCX4473619.1 hypothetical protein [Micromonospora sp. NBC_01655]
MLVTLAVVTFVHQRAAPAEARPFLRGLGTPIVAAASVSVAAAFTATLVFPGRRPTRPRLHPRLDPAEPTGYRPPGTAGRLLVGRTGRTHHAPDRHRGAATLPLSRRRRRDLAKHAVEQDYPHVPGEAVPRLHAVRKAIAKSHVTEELDPTLVAFFAISSLGLATIVLDLIGIGPTQLVTKLSGQHNGTAVLAAYVTDAGIWIVSLLVIVGFCAYRSVETRRVVVVFWDSPSGRVRSTRSAPARAGARAGGAPASGFPDNSQRSRLVFPGQPPAFHGGAW